MRLVTFLFLLTSLSAFAAPEGQWVVVKKSCDGVPVSILQNEGLNFVSGFFIHVYRISQTSDQYCSEAKVFTELFTGNVAGPDGVVEDSTLTPVGVKTACFDSSGKKISEKIEDLKEKGGNLRTDFKDKSGGKVDLTYSSDCKGILHFEVVPKTN